MIYDIIIVYSVLVHCGRDGIMRKMINKIMVLVIALSILIAVVGVGGCGRAFAKEGHSDKLENFGNRYLLPNNHIRDQALDRFVVGVDISGQRVYLDEFAGYWRTAGVWNIGVVADDYYIDYLNTYHDFGGQVVYIQKIFSYNFLRQIEIVLEDVRSELNISSASIWERFNRVEIWIVYEEYRAPIVAHLQTIDLYQYDAIYFSIGPPSNTLPRRPYVYIIIVALIGITAIVAITVFFLVLYKLGNKESI